MGNNKIEEIDINKIFSNTENPRNIKNDKFDKLCESIKSFPEMLNIRPIVINSKNEIIGGNMRYKACKVIGLKKVPIIRANNLTQEQEKEFIIKDNVSSGQWDFDILGNEWDDLDLDLWGLDVWNDTKDNTLLEKEIEEKEVKVEKYKVKKGQMWKLGNHLLLCSDSTVEKNYKKLIQNKKIDCVFIDPPYDMDNDLQKKSIEIINKYIDNANILFMTAISSLLYLYNFLTTLFKFRYDIIWKRNIPHIGANLKKPLIFHTNIHIYGKNKYFFNRLNTLEQIDRIRSVIEEPKNLNLGRGNKPINLMIQLLQAFSNENILDPFGGNGSTLIACEKLNKKCFTIEILPEFCDKIIKRWEDETNQKAVLLND